MDACWWTAKGTPKWDKFENSEQGVDAMLKKVPKNAGIVMEATGYYHYAITHTCVLRGRKAYVCNPRQISYHAKAIGQKGKNDKADALLVLRYATMHADNEDILREWKEPEDGMEEARPLLAAVGLLRKQETALRNAIKSLAHSGSANTALFALGAAKDEIEHQRDEAAKELTRVAHKSQPEEFALITSVKGVGALTAASLMAATSNIGSLANFKKSNALVAYLGLCPAPKQSGKSQDKKGKITKQGNPNARAALFMAAMVASKHNPACKQFRERLLARGKARKDAQTAVAAKLTRIIWSIVKNGKPWEDLTKQAVPEAL
jgi:transposase